MLYWFVFQAIVGGGIGGTSAAYFMRQLFGSTVHIDVYESSEKLCGRVSTVKVNNRMYESGASIIHGKNMYAHAAAKMFGKIFLVVNCIISYCEHSLINQWAFVKKASSQNDELSVAYSLQSIV